jgi:hypothetical protein
MVSLFDCLPGGKRRALGDVKRASLRWVLDEEEIMIAVAIVASIVLLALILFAGYIGAGLRGGSDYR